MLFFKYSANTDPKKFFLGMLNEFTAQEPNKPVLAIINFFYSLNAKGKTCHVYGKWLYIFFLLYMYISI